VEGGESTVGISRAKATRTEGENSHHHKKRGIKKNNQGAIADSFRNKRNTVTTTKSIWSEIKLKRI